jgi:hypothetical protein
VPESTLERELIDLGRHLAWPAPPDLASSIGSVLRTTPVTVLPRRRSRRVAVLAAAVLVVAGLLAVSPGLRAALLDLFRLPGARIEVEPIPSPVPMASGDLTDLAPGRRVTLPAARSAAAFPVEVPAALGPPDEVVIAGSGDAAIVTMAWNARPGLAAADETGYGALLTQFRARARDDLVKKVSQEGRVVPVVVDGQQGYWVEGPHAVLLERGRMVFEDRPRLSTSSLLWTRGEVLIRLEADVRLAEALRLAESLP